MRPYPFPVKHINIGQDIEIAYVDEGEGDEILLFIHGLGNYLPVWKQNISELSKHFRCIAIDLPGNGQSSKADRPYTLFFYAECIYRFIKTLNLQGVIPVGHSMGGQISMILSLRYPTEIQRLILIAPSGFEYFNPMEKQLIKSMLQMGSFIYSDDMSIETSIQNSFFRKVKQQSASIIQDLKSIMHKQPLQHWRKMVQANIAAMLDEAVIPFLPELQTDTLVIFGNEDRMIPNQFIHPSQTTLTVAKTGSALIPRAKLHIVEHAGHFVQLEESKLCNQYILHFILPAKNPSA